MRKLPTNRLHACGERLIVDNFAGGGGASTGIERALGRSPDVAINHDPEALAMHRANHPWTRHYATDVFDVDPRVVCRNRPVGLAWFSPDCTHHSKARGGKPIREAGKKSRSLAWVVVRWARHVRPEVIILENVEEFQQWGPLVDGKPCPARKGKTFKLWVRSLERLGYAVEWRELRACDYGAPTIRKRLFVIARCDGQPIVWPSPTHGKPGSPEVIAGERLPWRTAAEIIDWSLPCPSIFLTPEEARAIGCKRPLQPNTLKRIARGLKRYVLDHPNPFIVHCNHGGDEFRGQGIDRPIATVTASRDAMGLVTPIISSYYGSTSTGDSRCQRPDEPLPTQSTENRFGVVAPYAVPRYTERDGQQPRCHGVDQPAATITPTANGASLVAAFMGQHNAGDHNQNATGRPATAPLSTITTRGTQQQIVAATLGRSRVTEVMAFLQTYYGQGDGQECGEPMRTVVTKERFGLVTVHGIDYQIVDIGMRMLSPRELYRAQGFPDSYRIDIEHLGKRLTKQSQVRMCGNSVCPPLAEALVRANCRHLAVRHEPAARRQLELVGV
jgi:DNA (cytosine-5)-methyltransferase 1